MRNKLLILVVCAMIATPALAERKNRSNKHEAAGFGSGLAVGAAAGGPIGAIIGAAMGGMFGDKYHKEREGRIESEQALADARDSAESLAEMLQGSEQRIAGLESDLAVEQRNFRQTLQEAIDTQVFFYTAKADIDEASRENLARMASILKPVDGFVIRLEGHADARGAEDYNEQLSAERAAAVRDVLVSAGFPASRISVSAEGETYSQASEQDLDGLALDRKVHIELLDMKDSERVARK